MTFDEVFGDARTVLFVHAHPDDETLATGGLIAELADRGVEVVVLTATRGEQGELVPGAVPHLASADGSVDPDALTAHRETEVTDACRHLGVARHAFLGRARVSGRYTDSGMRWLDASETVAGPGDSAGPDALSLADPAEVAADVAAFAAFVGADVLVTYDERGGYGHPDHVALHAPGLEAARAAGARFWEVASDVDAPGVRLETPAQLDRVREALRCYASQLTVDGDEVVHVGGQRQPIALAFTLRER